MSSWPTRGRRRRPGVRFHFFDDEAQLQQFTNWDMTRDHKSYLRPNQWAEKHYLGSVVREGADGPWQLTDNRGRKLVELR